MADLMSYFKVMLIAQLFFSISVVMISQNLPAGAVNYVNSFEDVGNTFSLNETSSKVQESVKSQTSLPLIELGALVFYSGNILVDLLLNFAFAVPAMVGLLINGLMVLFNLDQAIVASLTLFAMVATTVLYFMSVLQLLTGIRSGRLV